MSSCRLTNWGTWMRAVLPESSFPGSASVSQLVPSATRAVLLLCASEQMSTALIAGDQSCCKGPHLL